MSQMSAAAKRTTPVNSLTRRVRADSAKQFLLRLP
jgi:hypothetical protein